MVLDFAIPGTDTMNLSTYTAEGERHEVSFTECGRVYTATTLPDCAMAVREHDPSLEPKRNACAEMDNMAAAEAQAPQSGAPPRDGGGVGAMQWGRN